MMNQGNFILVNGSFIPAADYRISIQESEGLLFAEKIRSVRTSFPLFRPSLEMMKLKLQIFRQSLPYLMDNDGAELKRQMERTLTKNKHFLGAVLSVRFWFFEQKLQYSIQSTKTEHTGYELNNKGMYISISRDIWKSVSSLSNCSLGSEIYWNISSNANDSQVDELVLLNDEDQIIEAPRSNIYLLKSGVIKGASIHHGAYADITKSLLLKIFDTLKITYDESDGLTEQDLKEADEIFLVNALDGIRWVIGFEGKRYFNQTTRKINNLFVKSFAT
ncbi:MAG TPA: aminotransferase class IV [Prolixibacteraceae bacterium]|jgi:branched-subunit amino acid aminotransferase/4-amino-4-deoxychorismate lyase